ncbi:MAG: hypothetical protein QOD93_4970 [Acetobacteraceae bacterium]|jgi:hypothetical protein|nr:hypothetical protein [Acetobacteraceae bacterium]
MTTVYFAPAMVALLATVASALTIKVGVPDGSHAEIMDAARPRSTLAGRAWFMALIRSLA